MGITIQFRGFGVYPNPRLVELPSDHPQVNRMKDWASVRQREQRDKLRNSRPIKGPGLRHKGVPAATARGRARGSEDQGHSADMSRGASAASRVSSRPSSTRPMTQGSMLSYRSIDSEDEYNRVLDGGFIVAACGVDTPEDISTARLQHCGLVDCVEEDMAHFTNLAHLDVSGNAVSFESLSLLPRIEVLEMALNGLNWVDPRAGFQTLSILDLSFNKIQPDAILNLGRLPNLTSLDLSNNDLRELPLSMAASEVATFENLETLNLNDNFLTSPGVFQALAGLPSLLMLDLNNNKIEFVPHLVPSAAQTEAYDVHAVHPFQALQLLGLAKNVIAKAEDIITVANWDNLQALHLWGNPLSTQNSALPGSLAQELGGRADRRQPGLVVSRTAPTEQRANVAGLLRPDAFVRVTPTVIPPIERGTSLRRYEEDKAKRRYIQYTTVRGAATAGPMSPTPVLPPIEHPEPAPVPDSDSEDEEGGESGFFITQVDEGALKKSKRGGVLASDDAVLLQTVDFSSVGADGADGADGAGHRAGPSVPMQPAAGPAPGAMSATTRDLAQGVQSMALAEIEGPAASTNHDRQLALLPAGVSDQFSVLFRDDTEEEKLLAKPAKALPATAKATSNQLRFMLQHPLTVVFERKDQTRRGPSSSANSRSGKGKRSAQQRANSTREWEVQNLQEAIHSLQYQRT